MIAYNIENGVVNPEIKNEISKWFLSQREFKNDITYKSLIDDMLLTLSPNNINQMYEDLNKKKSPSLEKEKIYFITLNPDSSKCSFKQFEEATSTYLNNSKIFQHCTYSYDNTVKGHFHCHLICDKYQSPSTVRHNVFNSPKFKNMFGHVKHIHIVEYPKSYTNDKIEYMKGNKWDPLKDDHVEYTKKWRQSLLLQDAYQNF